MVIASDERDRGMADGGRAFGCPVIGAFEFVKEKEV
jgi:hypothetical protein